MPRWLLLTAAATAVLTAHAVGPAANANAQPGGMSRPLCVQVILHVFGHVPITVLTVGCASSSPPGPPPTETTNSPAPPAPTNSTTGPSGPTTMPPGASGPDPGSTSSVPAVAPGMESRSDSTDPSMSIGPAIGRNPSKPDTGTGLTSGTTPPRVHDAIGRQERRLRGDVGQWGRPDEPLEDVFGPPVTAARPWSLALVVLLVLLATVVRRGRT